MRVVTFQPQRYNLAIGHILHARPRLKFMNEKTESWSSNSKHGFHHKFKAPPSQACKNILLLVTAAMTHSYGTSHPKIFIRNRLTKRILLELMHESNANRTKNVRCASVVTQKWWHVLGTKNRLCQTLSYHHFQPP